jgi:hypothetical protein
MDHDSARFTASQRQSVALSENSGHGKAFLRAGPGRALYGVVSSSGVVKKKGCSLQPGTQLLLFLFTKKHCCFFVNATG